MAVHVADALPTGNLSGLMGCANRVLLQFPAAGDVGDSCAGQFYGKDNEHGHERVPDRGGFGDAVAKPGIPAVGAAAVSECEQLIEIIGIIL